MHVDLCTSVRLRVLQQPWLHATALQVCKSCMDAFIICLAGDNHGSEEEEGGGKDFDGQFSLFPAEYSILQIPELRTNPSVTKTDIPIRSVVR